MKESRIAQLEAKDYTHFAHVKEDVIQFRLDDNKHDIITL